MKQLINDDLLFVKDQMSHLSIVEGHKLAYASARTLSRVNKEIEVMEALLKPTEEIELFKKEVEDLQQKHAEKKKNGDVRLKHKIENGIPVEKINIPKENRTVFQEEYEELEVKHKKAIKEMKAQKKNFEKMLEEPITIEFFKIKKKDLPKNLTGDQFVAAAFILDGKIIESEVPKKATQKNWTTLIEYFDI